MTAALGAVAVLASGCRPPAGAGLAPTLPRSAVVDVVNAGDATVTRLDGATGRPLGRPIPTGPGPWQVAVGPDGSALVLPAAAAAGGAVRHVGRAGAGWNMDEVRLDPPAHAGAGRFLTRVVDGPRGATVAVAYEGAAPDEADAAPAGRCRVGLVDVRTGAAGRGHGVCLAGEALTALALTPGPTGPVAYAGLWRRARAAPGGWAAAAGRVVAVDAQSGRVLSSRPVPGVPRGLHVAAAPGGGGERVYCLVALPSPDAREPDDPDGADRGVLLSLDPATLDATGEVALPGAPRWFAAAPEGDLGYAHAGGTEVLRIDLADGAVGPLVRFPAPARGLAVVGNTLYAADPAGDRVWAVDRRRGRVTGAVPVGRRPVEVTSGEAA